LKLLKYDYTSVEKLRQLEDDAIAQLADQLLAISTRLQEIERKQAI